MHQHRLFYLSFLYLQIHLTGSAAELLRNTPITDANYDGAGNAREARYGSKIILTNFRMNSIINLQLPQKRSSTEIKRVLYLTFSSNQFAFLFLWINSLKMG